MTSLLLLTYQSHLWEAISLADDSFADVLAKGAEAVRDLVLAEVDCQAALMHAAASPKVRIDRGLPPIETLGPYRLIRLLGNGEMETAQALTTPHHYSEPRTKLNWDTRTGQGFCASRQRLPSSRPSLSG